MALFRKAANVLGKAVSNHEVSLSKPSIFQAIRCMSSSKLFIGGLSYSTDDTSLREAFGKYGDVAEARVIVDRDTGRSRGFGFITFTSTDEASAAIQALDQQELHGRRIRVDFANDRARGYGGGGFGGGGSYGGGGGGGGYNDGGYGGNYGSGSGGYNNSYGGNTGGGGGYGGASNFSPTGTGYGNGAGTDAYPANGGEGQTGGGNYAGNSSYAGGNLSYGDGQNFGATAGSGNNFGEVGVGSSPSSFGNNFGGEQSTFSRDEPVNGNFRDDDTSDNYADRRG